MELVRCRLLAILLLSAFCTRCAGPSHGTPLKPPATFLDTVLINVPAAVFYSPDSLQLLEIKSVTDTGIFASMEHDCFYQMRNARIVLKHSYPNIMIIEVKNARYLMFKKTTGEEDIIDLNTTNDPCGIFIFDAVKLPRVTDMTNIETDLGFYFSK